MISPWLTPAIFERRVVTLKVLGHHTVYRNPTPNRVSEYVAFPAIQSLPDGTLLCMCRHGTARESNDGVIRVHRSMDGGHSWSPTGPLPGPEHPHVGIPFPGGFGLALDGDVIAWVCHPDRDGHNQGFTSRSNDGGTTWSLLAPVDPAPFEKMAPGGNLVTLRDGMMVAVSETRLDGDAPDLPNWTSLLTRSFDGGRTWETIRSIHMSDDPHYFDFRITALEDGRLLGAYWTHDLRTDRGLNVHMTWSTDAGETWTAPHDAGFWGQVTDVCGLVSGGVLAVTNHRRSPLGVRALLSGDGGASFCQEEYCELWGIDPPTIRSAPMLADRRDSSKNALDAYHHFTFGTPSVTQMSDGMIIVAYYVTEELVTYVRCCRIQEVSTDH